MKCRMVMDFEAPSDADARLCGEQAHMIVKLTLRNIAHVTPEVTYYGVRELGSDGKPLDHAV